MDPIHPMDLIDPMDISKNRAYKDDSIVFGDINGKIDEFLAKLKALQPKHQFTCAIVVGNLFDDADSPNDTTRDAIERLISGNTEIPLPVYFTLGRRPLPEVVIQRLESNQAELCHNLIFLGRSSSVKTAEGFRLVSISGQHSLKVAEGGLESAYTDEDTNISAALTSCDILLTSQWPSHIMQRSRASYNGSEPPPGIDCLGDLCQRLKPRYYFSASEAFYEREPFFHPNNGETQPVTRFISIAPFGNASKQKAMYAFTLESDSDVTKAIPSGSTASPFPVTKKRKTEPENGGMNSFRYSTAHSYSDDSRGRPYKRGKHQAPQECYFCLSRDAGRHMITSIGDQLYMTIAKGPLTTAKTFPSLGFPCHMLIIPVAHEPTIRGMPEDERQLTINEMQKYRDSLHEMLVAKSQDPDSGRAELGSVTWEITRSSGVHFHWQFLPIPVTLIESGLVEAAFVREAENREYPRFAKNADEVESAEDGDFFKVKIWSQAASKDLVLPFDQSFRFDLQFGRHVLAKLLDLWERADWKACAQEEAEEAADVEVFRKNFKEYDFSLK